MFTNDDIIYQIIPYRLQAIEIANVVISLRTDWDVPKSMKIYFDDQLMITGSSNAFTNPVLETGLIHCRALLDFLGLKVDLKDPTKLKNRNHKRRRQDDFVIEYFIDENNHPLSLVSPQDAVSLYQGPASEAEAALAGVLHCANKGLAHMTSGLLLDATDIQHFEIASRGTKNLIERYFYTPLGISPPEYKAIELIS